MAARIAKDLVEGGIDDPATLTVNAAHYQVPMAVVKRIRRVLLGPFHARRNQTWVGGGELYKMKLQRAVSMVDAIENGWEDVSLGVTREA